MGLIETIIISWTCFYSRNDDGVDLRLRTLSFSSCREVIPPENINRNLLFTFFHR